MKLLTFSKHTTTQGQKSYSRARKYHILISGQISCCFSPSVISSGTSGSALHQVRRAVFGRGEGGRRPARITDRGWYLLKRPYASDSDGDVIGNILHNNFSVARTHGGRVHAGAGARPHSWGTMGGN